MPAELDRRRAERTSPLDAASEMSRKEISAKPVVAPEDLMYPRLRDLVEPAEDVHESEVPRGRASTGGSVAEFLRKAAPNDPP